MKTFWVRFDFGNGQFLEKEFISDDKLYEYIEDYHFNIIDWKRVKGPNE
jgi:hypothetical protein